MFGSYEVILETCSFHVWQRGGDVESQCCQGDVWKRRTQFHSNGHKCPDAAWTEVTAATERAPLEIVRDFVLVLALRVGEKRRFQSAGPYGRRAFSQKHIHPALSEVVSKRRLLGDREAT